MPTYSIPGKARCVGKREYKRRETPETSPESEPFKASLSGTDFIVEFTTANGKFFLCGHDSTDWTYLEHMEEACGFLHKAHATAYARRHQPPGCLSFAVATLSVFRDVWKQDAADLSR